MVEEPRPRGPKRRLSEDEFARIALTVIDSEGLGALNVRRLATELNMSPGSLYTYFSNKDALLDRMLALALETTPTEASDATPQDALVSLFRRQFEAFTHHPGAIELVMAGVASPEIDQLREQMLRLFEDSGLSTAQCVRAADLMMSHVIGNVLVESTRQSRSDRGSELERRRSLPADDFPHLRRASLEATQPHPGEVFELGLAALLSALLAAAHEDPEPPPLTAKAPTSSTAIPDVS